MTGHGGRRAGAGRPKGAKDAAPRLPVKRGPRGPCNDLAARAQAVQVEHPDWGPKEIAAELGGGVTRQAVWAALRRKA